MYRTNAETSIGKVFFFLTLYIGYISTAEIEELRYCLLDLQLSELLRLQHSMESMKTDQQWINSTLSNQVINQKSSDEYPTKSAVDDKDSCPTQNCMKPIAMALTGQPRGYHGDTVYHHHHHPWQPEEKQSKLQTLFNVSITALAFLSFGGYLLCLIVQAIKSKGTTYFHPIATASTTTNGGVKRIKIYRRGRREATVDNDNAVWVMNYGYGHLF